MYTAIIPLIVRVSGNLLIRVLRGSHPMLPAEKNQGCVLPREERKHCVCLSKILHVFGKLRWELQRRVVSNLRRAASPFDLIDGMP